MRYFVLMFLSLVILLNHGTAVHATTDDSSSEILLKLGTNDLGIQKKTLHEDGVPDDYLALTNPSIKIENLRGGKLFAGNEHNGPGIIINDNKHWLITGTNNGMPFLIFGVSFYSTSGDIWVEKYIYFGKMGAILILFIIILSRIKKSNFNLVLSHQLLE